MKDLIGKQTLIILTAIILLGLPGVSRADFECGTQQNYLSKHGARQSTSEGCQIGPCDDPAERDQWIPSPTGPNTKIRIVFNVFCDDNGENCVCEEQHIDDAVADLNAAFDPVGFEFDHITHFINDPGYTYGGTAWPDDGMKIQYAFYPEMFLNVFVTRIGPDGLERSEGTYPWAVNALNATGGVIMYINHMMQGALPHEVAHCLGLWHMFKGVNETSEQDECYEWARSRCEGSGLYDGDIVGDLCCDTRPYDKENTQDCVAMGSDGNKDPWNLYGEPDLSNWMTYSDECWDPGHFTDQQAGRMHCWYNDPNYLDRAWSPRGKDRILVPYDAFLIQTAAQWAQNDDTVLVFPGLYPGIVDFMGKRIVIRSVDGPESTTIQVNGDFPVVKFDSNEPKGAELSGFTIRGSTQTGIYCKFSSPTICNNVIVDNTSLYYGSAISMHGTSGSMVENNTIVSDTGNGLFHSSIVFVSGCDQDTIRNNLLYDCQAEQAIRVNSSNALVVNNTIDASSTDYGVRVHGYPLAEKIVDVRNNIVINASQYGVYADQLTKAAVYYNDLWNCAAAATAGPSIIGDVGNITLDPILAPDYHLTGWSPCINAGDPDPVYNDPDDTRNDMGAFYYQLRNIYVPDDYSTIQAAITSAANGEVVHVRPGTYVENLDFLGRAITVVSTDGADVTTIDVATADPSIPAVQFVTGELKGAVLEGFTVTGSDSCGILSVGSSPTILDNIIEYNTGPTATVGVAAHFSNTVGARFDGNVMRSNTVQASGGIIWDEGGTDDTISYNLIYGCGGGSGIRVVSSQARIYNNTIDGSDLHGMYVTGASTIDCRNSIIINSDGYGILAATNAPQSTLIEYTDTYDNGSGSFSGIGINLGLGNISEDPVFQSNPPATDLYELTDDSPCEDAGDPALEYRHACTDPQTQAGLTNDMGWNPCCHCEADGSGPDSKIVEAADASDPSLPTCFGLGPNYPNPFNPSTDISFDLPVAAKVRLEILNLLGQRVKTLVDGARAAGSHTVTWNGSNSEGQRVASGVYFYRLSAGDFVETRKMVLMK